LETKRAETNKKKERKEKKRKETEKNLTALFGDNSIEKTLRKTPSRTHAHYVKIDHTRLFWARPQL
jgi:GTP cyclohydrolase I